LLRGFGFAPYCIRRNAILVNFREIASESGVLIKSGVDVGEWFSSNNLTKS